MEGLIDLLKQRIREGNLPGVSAHFKMAHSGRIPNQNIPGDARLAGVLCLLYPAGEQWKFALIQRSGDQPDDRHSGQISFPGGKKDEQDPSLEATALRECEEELGIQQDRIEIAGPMSQLYIPVSNFLVFPFVGFMNERPQFIPRPEEVKKVLEIPLDTLRHPHARQETDIRIGANLILKRVPYYNLGQEVVWGATAMILSELNELMDSLEI